MSAGLMSFPPFRGLTRLLVLWNVGVYFALTLLAIVSTPVAISVVNALALWPDRFLHGFVWQIVSYAFVHGGTSVGAIIGIAAELLSLWFLGALLEEMHGSRWMGEIFFCSVIGAGIAGVVLGVALHAGGFLFSGSYGGLFGMLVAFGVLHGDMEFLMFPLPMMMKAKYMAVVAGVIALALLFSAESVFAFSNLGGAIFGWLYIKFAPRRGFAFVGSESLFGLRNSFYRWKRRRAAKKFEVYMRKHNGNGSGQGPGSVN
jgi:membrane associated rhomboid family serine protease